jgi:hypothetical protein
MRRRRSDFGRRQTRAPCTEPSFESFALPGEEWRPVVGWERFYRVSTLGRVFSLHQYGRIVTGMRVRGGYRVLKVRDGDRKGNVMVHHLVLEAFAGPAPQGTEGCHWNGVADDNRLLNLRWDTPLANQDDRRRHGTTLLGEKAGRKLTPDLVSEIRTAKRTDSHYARLLKINLQTVHNARTGKTWKHVQTPPDCRPRGPGNYHSHDMARYDDRRAEDSTAEHT